MSNASLIEVKGLKKYFSVEGGFFSKSKLYVHSVDGISFNINEGEIFCLVGESGCGKTTTGRLLLGLIKPTAGSIHFMGYDISKLSKNDMRMIRSKMQIIFQDTLASLNPQKTILSILSQPYIINNKSRYGHMPFVINPPLKKEIYQNVCGLLELVGIDPPEKFLNRYPHELSGGQRQRIGIARAIALHPKLIVADEPVSSIDVSMRGQIINLMKELQNDFKITYLYITHDLSTCRSVGNVVAIMYLGKIVEQGTVEELFNKPLHPYTKALFSATPIPNPRKTRIKNRIILKKELPSPINPPLGCRFHTRCPYTMPKCAKKEPEFINVGNDHFVACHL